MCASPPSRACAGSARPAQGQVRAARPLRQGTPPPAGRLYRAPRNRGRSLARGLQPAHRGTRRPVAQEPGGEADGKAVDARGRLPARRLRSHGHDRNSPSEPPERQSRTNPDLSRKYGGEGGIRTHETGTPPTRVPGVRLRPLGHLTAGGADYTHRDAFGKERVSRLYSPGPCTSPSGIRLAISYLSGIRNRLRSPPCQTLSGSPI